MNLTAVAGLANVLSLIVFILLAAWQVAPWLKSRPRAPALVPLVWVNAFRHVALQIYSAQQSGFAVSDGARDQIAAGDVIGMMLAVAALAALHYRARVAALLVWILVAETAFDLVRTTILGVQEQLYATASGVTFLIVTFYVPLLWVTLGLMAWQLIFRRNEPLTQRHAP
jgi:hypothetical protein